MAKSNGLESSLFDWEDWDIIEDGVYNFAGVMLKVDVGDYPAGHTFSHAVFDMQKSTVTFYDNPDSEEGHTYELIVSIGKKK